MTMETGIDVQLLCLIHDYSKLHPKDLEDHFLIHCNRLIIDSVSSCPLGVSLYSTRGGISLNDCLFKIPLFSNSFKRIVRVLLLKPFIDFLNVKYLTGSVEQQRGINISRVPLLVIIFLNSDVSFIRFSTS